jgi:hypothetical protein
MSKPASSVAEAPTTTRNTSSATPAHPDGKLENALCSDMLLAEFAIQF